LGPKILQKGITGVCSLHALLHQHLETKEVEERDNVIVHKSGLGEVEGVARDDVGRFAIRLLPVVALFNPVTSA